MVIRIFNCSRGNLRAIKTDRPRAHRASQSINQHRVRIYDMNATFVVLLSSLLMGTSFLQEVPADAERDGDGKLDTGARSYLANHPLLVGAGPLRHAGCPQDRAPPRGQYQEEEEFGRPRRRLPADPPPDPEAAGCRVRFGLQYASCFSKHRDFDDKFGELRHHVTSLPRGHSGAASVESPCRTLQLLAKVKSSPVFDRCHGNQYALRTPYHMYNVKGELRYIVQDPPNLEQCYLEASCSIPGDTCRGYGYGGRRSAPWCESRRCHHTLLSWDPDNPDAGTFFDIFEYACCCNCRDEPTVPSQHHGLREGRPPLNDRGQR